MGIILFLNKKRLLTKEQRQERLQWVGNQTETRISIENHFFRANKLYMETWKWLYCKGFSYQGPYETLYISSYGPLLWPLVYSATTAKSCQSCPTLCNPRDGRPPGSPVPGILQARILEWVAVAFSQLGQIIVLFWVFWGTSIPFSIVAISIYSYQQFKRISFSLHAL